VQQRLSIGDKWKAQREAAGARKLTLQVADALAASENSHDCATILSVVVSEERWRHLSSSQGKPYEDFGAYACDKYPKGLGVRDERRAKLLKTALLMTGQIFAWITVLERIARPRGRPPKNSTLGEGFERFYTLQRSATATDQIYLALHRLGHKDLLAQISTGELSAKQAAIKAGLVPESNSSQGPVCDLPRFRKMSEKAQAKWAGRVFCAMNLQAQCVFIERQLGRYAKDLAAQWAARRAPNSGAHSG
jgi:AT-hook transcription factor